ncbi:MAG: hypothetical protein WCP30_03930 [Mycobacteriaceae bacterium]
MDDWDTYPVDQAQPPAAPWSRNPRLLFGLIAVAAAALVVATVLLITGRQSGEIPTAPQLSTRTTPNTPSAPSSPRPPSEPASSTPPSSSPSAESSAAGSEESLAPAEPEQPAEPAVAPPPSPTASHSPAGPKINVTRTPMSFTPGKH